MFLKNTTELNSIYQIKKCLEKAAEKNETHFFCNISSTGCASLLMSIKPNEQRLQPQNIYGQNKNYGF